VLLFPLRYPADPQHRWFSRKSSTFDKLFGRKPVKTLEQPSSAIEFIGDIQGSGLNALRIEIAKRLRDFAPVTNARLAKLKYLGEKQPRICLIVNAPPLPDTQKQEIALACSDIVAMDIFFEESLPSRLMGQVVSKCSLLLIPDLKLFECPIIVGRGANVEMPTDWKCAIICFFVAAKDYQEALFIAVSQLRSDGYEYKTVYDGKVNMLDPSKWWSGYVMEKWASHASHFPSQEDMEAIVATGGYFKGPALEWQHEPRKQ